MVLWESTERRNASAKDVMSEEWHPGTCQDTQGTRRRDAICAGGADGHLPRHIRQKLQDVRQKTCEAKATRCKADVSGCDDVMREGVAAGVWGKGLG
eukprot:3106582-Rhodomonas_salina.1